MKAFVKYAALLASGLAIGVYLHEPPKLDRFVALPSLEEIDVVVREALAAARPKANVTPADPAAAALVEEDLDYRIAERVKSLEGWRAFVADHPNGLYAQEAKGKIDGLIAAADRTNAAEPQKPPESGRPAEEASGAAQSQAKSESDADHGVAGIQVAALESKAPATVAQTLNAAAEQSAAAETVAAADPSATTEPASAAVSPARMNGPSGSDSTRASALPSPPQKPALAGPPKRRAAPRPDKARVTASAHRHESVGHPHHCSRSGCHWRHPELPPILMALLGEKPRGFGAFERTSVADRSTPGQHR